MSFTSSSSYDSDSTPLEMERSGEKDLVRDADRIDMMERLEDVMALENETALFECKVLFEYKPICTWYKNGVQLQENQRTVITSDGDWQRLEIKEVQVSDHGLYILECKHLGRHIIVKHHLHVAPQEINECVVHNSMKYTGMGVLRHLKNTRVYAGEKIYMEATFISGTYSWFKNNEPVHPDNRTTIINSETCASLTISDAQPTDTGVYSVMAITNHGYFTSFTDVVVGKEEENIPLLPMIEESPPEEVKGFTGEEIRVNLKVQTDAYTIYKCLRNDMAIVTEEVKIRDYGNNFIGFTIPSPKLSSTGCYELGLINSQNKHFVTAKTRIKVKAPPELLSNEVYVVRQLESAVACCGAKVSFDCSFSLEDTRYFYVVWYIGHYKVERTNSLFTVICGRGNYVLYINSFEPGMAGEVVCELRRAFPNRLSVKVQRAYANLACVPPCVIQQLRPTQIRSKLILSANPEYGNARHIRRRRIWAWLLSCCPISLNLSRLPLTATQCREAAPSCSSNADYLLQIVFCKINNEGLYFMNTTHGQDNRLSRIQLHRTGVGVHELTVLQWIDSNASTEIWYSIQMGQEDGNYKEAGVTHQPSFVVAKLPIDRLMVFRIYDTIPWKNALESTITIVPPPEIVLRPLCPKMVQGVDDFLETYIKTDTMVGSGAFGSVVLVINKVDRREYAAKVVKARTTQKRLTIQREFHVMKKLRHQKLVQLLGFYEMSTNFIFVMEYFWGGELFDRVARDELLKETDVVNYVRQICEALKYLHSCDIVHLDIKPENIICINPNSLLVKIIDFGLARNIAEGFTRVLYGTKDYVAPEVIGFEPISTYSDMWSVGVVVYVLLSGLMPFVGEDWLARSVSITSVLYDYNDYAFDEVSDLAKDFVDHLLLRIPKDRMSAEEALNHTWLVDGPPKRAAFKRMTRMRKNMKSYLYEYRNRWQKARNVVIAANRLRMRARYDERSNLP